jgi:hypothetical protein
MASGASLRVQLRAVRQIGRTRRQQRHVESLRDLVANRARLRRYLRGKCMPLHALEERLEPLHQVGGLRPRLVAQLLRRLLDEMLLLGELVLRKHLTRRADRLRVIAGNVVEKRDGPAQILAGLRLRRARDEGENENQSQHWRTEYRAGRPVVTLAEPWQAVALTCP